MNQIYEGSIFFFSIYFRSRKKITKILRLKAPFKNKSPTSNYMLVIVATFLLKILNEKNNNFHQFKFKGFIRQP